MKKLLATVPLITLVCCVWGCQAQATFTQPVDLQSEEKAVREAVSQVWRSMQTKDIELFLEAFAIDPDTAVFSTDPTQRWVGYEAFKAAQEGIFAAVKSWEITAHDEVVKLHSSGEVAWGSAVVNVKVTVGDDVLPVRVIRLTGVMEKRDGRWVCVQYHASTS